LGDDYILNERNDYKLHSNKLSNTKLKKLDEFIETVPKNQSSLIAVLHKAQKLFGYLPSELQEYIGEKLNISTANVFGVVTFYSYFTTEPKGKHVISICMGTACFVKGSSDVLNEFERKLGIRAGETTPDGKFTIETIRCIGACGLAPVITIDDKVYGHCTVDMVDKILQNFSE